MIPLFIEGRYMITVTKKDLIALGYGPSYQSRKLDRVPKEAVEELLGIKLPDEQNQ